MRSQPTKATPAIAPAASLMKSLRVATSSSDRNARYGLIPSSFAAVSPSIAARSSSLRPGVPRMWSTEVLRPRERIVGAHDDLARADLGHQVAQRLGREDERVEVELPQILGRLLLELRRGAPVREGHADRVGARRVRRQVAAAVRRADLQSREAIERALEDQVRERDRGLERVADRRCSSPPLPLSRLPKVPARRPLRMDEDQHAELLGLGPERVKLRVGQLLAVDAAADAGAAQPELLDAVLELLGGEVGILQRDRRERDEAVGLRRAHLRELLVLDLDELAARRRGRPCTSTD